MKPAGDRFTGPIHIFYDISLTSLHDITFSTSRNCLLFEIKEKVVASSVSLTGNGLLQNGGTAVKVSCE